MEVFAPEKVWNHLITFDNTNKIRGILNTTVNTRMYQDVCACVHMSTYTCVSDVCIIACKVCTLNMLNKGMIVSILISSISPTLGDMNVCPVINQQPNQDASLWTGRSRSRDWKMRLSIVAIERKTVEWPDVFAGHISVRVARWCSG